MDQRTREICDLIVENRAVLRTKMNWEAAPNSSAVLGAFLLAGAGARASAEQYAECRAILKKNAGIFSEFRGIAMSMVIVKMMLSGDPERYVKESMEVYRKLRAKHKFTASPYMVMAALTIHEHGGLEHADENIEKLEALHAALKKEHPMLIWDEDRGYLAMLVANGADSVSTTQEIEKCYRASADMWLNRDAAHSMAQVLALSARPADEKAAEAMELWHELKRIGKPIGRDWGMPVIGALTLLPGNAEGKAARLAELDDYLKTQKGFRWYDYDARVRRMFAGLIMFMSEADAGKLGISESITGTLAMSLIEEMITMLVVMMISVNTSVTTSSSN